MIVAAIAERGKEDSNGEIHERDAPSLSPIRQKDAARDASGRSGKNTALTCIKDKQTAAPHRIVKVVVRKRLPVRKLPGRVSEEPRGDIVRFVGNFKIHPVACVRLSIASYPALP